jgi:O-antigen ligase
MSKTAQAFSRAARTTVSGGRAASIPWVRDDAYSLLLLGMVWLMISYMLVPPHFFDPQNAQGAITMAAPNPISRAIKMGLLGLSALFIVWRAQLAWLLLRSTNPFFVFFLILAPASAAWSIDSSATIARVISIMSVTSVCFAFGLASWYRERFQNVMRPLVTCLLLASILIGIVSPELVETHDPGSPTLEGAWHGLASQKNPFGQLASYGIIFWLQAWLAGEKRWWESLVGGGIALACLGLSRSATSILATVFAIGFMLLLLRSPPNLRRYVPYIVVVFAATVLTYALAVLKIVPGLDVLLTPITAITGKDMTFSNRAEIWVIIKEHIQLAPYLGSGYGAYWIGPLPWSPSFEFMTRMFFYPTESHNGYLEAANDLGFVGLFCLFGYLAFFVRQSLQLLRVDRNQGALFLCLFFHQTVVNLSESCWLQINAFSFIIMTIATTALARSLLECRLTTYFGQPDVGITPVPAAHAHFGGSLTGPHP